MPSKSKFKILQDEVNIDPLSRGYSGMTDEEVAVSLNTVNLSEGRGTVPSIEVIASIKPADYPTGAKEQAYLSLLLSQDSVPLGDLDIRAGLRNIFTGKSETLSAMKSIETKDVSRAYQLGLVRIKTGYITAVRV